MFTAFALGTVVTLLAWGVAVGPHGRARGHRRRRSAAVALAMFAAASSHGYGALLVWMRARRHVRMRAALAASGRAVFGWFPRSERGLALGLRQTAVPAGAALASFTLPPLAARPPASHAPLYALAGRMLVAAVAGRDLAARRAARGVRRAAGARRRARPAHLAAERGQRR